MLLLSRKVSLPSGFLTTDIGNLKLITTRESFLPIFIYVSINFFSTSSSVEKSKSNSSVSI
jgi:hypothetical protein